MKSDSIKQKVDELSNKIDYTEPLRNTRIDPSSFTAKERLVIGMAQEIIAKYAPSAPPDEVFDENQDLFDKATQIINSRALNLFIRVFPLYVGNGGEIETWSSGIFSITSIENTLNA